MVRAALAGDDLDNAVRVLRELSFRRLDAIPQQFDLLFHDDEAVRRKARSVLANVGASLASDAGAKSPLDERLLAILDDPQQSARHADAVRALAAMFMLDTRSGEPGRAALYAQRRLAVANRLRDIMINGDESLLAPALAGASALASAQPRELVEQGYVPKDIPAERLQAIKKVAEQAENERARLIDERYYQQAYGYSLEPHRGPGGGFF
jgi:hypothetical protein